MRFRTSLFALLCVAFAGSGFAATIYVTTEVPGIGTGACSLQEAIYSSVLHDTLDGTHGIAIDATDPDHFISTGCVMGDGNDTIVLPTDGLITMSQDLDGDAYNFYGPTATPLIYSTITIEGNGATLQWDATAKGNVRLFAIVGWGSLTLRNVHVTGFHVKGGDGRDGGGGGLGAGGAIYVNGGGALVVENSTFDANRAVGGNGSQGSAGGGGGLSGNGGHEGSARFGSIGGGGGGARGNGGDTFGGGGGGGGGTVFSGGSAEVGGPGGYLCGGNGGGAGNDGAAGKCLGGGGGGGGECDFCGPGGLFSEEGNGGDGAYGGGGGGGHSGGRGGFGGGGGAIDFCAIPPCGGEGGFGGGGAAGASGGSFGGHGGDLGAAGGGGALGGAIFIDDGTLTVRNSTFTNNEVKRGLAAPGSNANNGSDAGGAIFSHDGDLTIVNSTFSGNQSTGSGAAVVAYMDPSDGPDIFIRFTLDNTIIANNSANECFFTGNVHTQGAGNLIMSNGSGSGPFGACPGVVLIDDPQLGSLQDNGGFTPTMAIPFNGIAMGAADAATSLAADQRGADRPQGNGWDIGAFEICRKKLLELVEPFPCGETRFKGSTTFPLTIDAAAGGGSVSPAPGTYQAPANTVTVLDATPNAGYYFNGWTGNVTSPSSASTTVIIDRAQSVTANFQLHDFTLSANPTSFTLPLGGTTTTSDVTASALGDFDDEITLAATGHPAGVAVSLSAKTVTPIVGTPAPSIVTIAVGPSAIPQSFTETITGESSGLSGALSHSAQIGVTFVITADALVKIINQDLALGCIASASFAQSLIGKVNAYQTLASAGNVLAASNVLAAFQSEVRAQIGHQIVSSCTDPVGGNTFSPGQALLADTRALQATLAVH